MKIIITSNTLWNIHNFRKEFIDTLINKNYEIFILTNEIEKNRKDFEDQRINFIKIFISRKIFTPITDLYVFFQYYYYFSKIKPDIVFSYTVKSNIISSIISKILKIKHISTITGLGTHVLKNRYIKKFIDILYKFSLNKNHKIFVHNNYDRDYLLDLLFINPKKIQRVYGSGVNLDQFKYNDYLNTSKKITTLLYVGRLISDKGIKEFLKSAEIVSNKRNNIQFDVVALVDKSNASSIHKHELDYYIDNKFINYYENEDNIISFFNKSSCVVLPSYREGLPKTLLEAIAIGRPIIASNVPGCNDLVKNNFNGYLFEVKNIDDLTNKIISFIDLDFDQKKNLAYNSFSMANKFDINRVLNEYIKEL